MVHFFAPGTITHTTALLVALVHCLCALDTFAEPSLSVVTTTSILADTTKRIGGESIEVKSLMGEGVDPHLYKASPGDLRLLAAADLVLHNGLHLEGKMAEALEKLAARKPVVAATEQIPTNLLRKANQSQSAYDPHVWFDVSLWRMVATHIRDVLTQHDPANTAGYQARFRDLDAELATLHSWCAAEIQKIPEPRRLLVTAHDAFGYFGHAYGIEVKGIQGLSTDSEASLQDIRHLVDLLVERKIPAVFIESSVSPRTIEALVEGSRSRGHALTIGGELFSDTLGAPNSPEGSYTGMIRHNVVTITSALTRSPPDDTTSD